METIEIPVDAALHANAQQVLLEEGLTISEAFSMFLRTVVHDGALPTSLLTPNGETVKAMNDAAEGRLESASSVAEFMKALREDD